MAQLNLGIMYLEYNTEEQSNWDWHSDKKTLHSKAEYWIAKAANGGPDKHNIFLVGYIFHTMRLKKTILKQYTIYVSQLIVERHWLRSSLVVNCMPKVEM